VCPNHIKTLRKRDIHESFSDCIKNTVCLPDSSSGSGEIQVCIPKLLCSGSGSGGASALEPPSSGSWDGSASVPR